MGIRPTIMTVFGLEDYQDILEGLDFERKPSLTLEQAKKEACENNNWDLIHVRDIAYNYSKKQWRSFYDLIYYGNWEMGAKGIAGLVLSSDFESKTFRALSLIYPEYEQSGYKVIPVVDDNERPFRLMDSKDIRPIGGIHFQESWLYGQGYHKRTPLWAFVAKWLLDDLGIVGTDPTQYKWMLVWEWS